MKSLGDFFCINMGGGLSVGPFLFNVSGKFFKVIFGCLQVLGLFTSGHATDFEIILINISINLV